MEQYRISLAGFDIEDEKLFLFQPDMVRGLEVIRKGETWNKRTGKKYEENAIRLLDSTTYEAGQVQEKARR